LNFNTVFFYNLNDVKNLTSFFIYNNVFYYNTLHYKLSSLSYSTQLIEIFVYETPASFLNIRKLIKVASHDLITVYSFFSILSQHRIFIFTIKNEPVNFKNPLKTKLLNSLAELFLNANWLEREAAELHGVFFLGKKDLRNLMLQYGDSTTPMLKNLPSIGTRDIYYDSVTDYLIQTPVTVQF